MSSSNTINLTAQITTLSTALRIVLNASPDAAQVREQLATALNSPFMTRRKKVCGTMQAASKPSRPYYWVDLR